MRKNTKSIMIQGTGSGVGKSIAVAALCRIFLQDGYKVAPFKAQNMALNSFVTKEGLEIGRAQAMQADACKISPTVDMNPILIKPSADTVAQIIIRGKPLKNMDVLEYVQYKKQKDAIRIIKESFDNLTKEFDIIVIEGAGSPAEVNLHSHDIVNMRMAKIAKSPVLLLGDIDKGGVFASLYGTVELLSRNERDRIKGFIINKFRGDISLLCPGLKFLERKTKIPVLGVIPYFHDIRLPEEDSVPDKYFKTNISDKKIDIKIIYLPHISNFTDFDALKNEADVNLEYIGKGKKLGTADIIIIPGSKNTVSDLKYLYENGYEKQIKENHDKGKMIIGICGGYQMLGKKIIDKLNIESKQKEINGLGLLNIVTVFKQTKTLTQVKAKHIESNRSVSGYEIHMGETEIFGREKPAFNIYEKMRKKVNIKDGARSRDKQVWGTYIHGVFDDKEFREFILNGVRQKKGLKIISSSDFNQDEEYDKLADLFRKNINMKLIYKILGAKKA